MKYFIYTITVIICFGLQIALFEQFSVLHTAPNIVLLISLFIAAKQPGYDFLFFSLMSGLAADLLLSAPLGSFLLGFVGLAAVVRLFFSSFVTIRFDWRHVPVVSLVGMALILLWLGVYSTLLRLLSVPVSVIDWSVVMGRFISQLVITALAMYPVYWFSEAIGKFIERIELRKKGLGL